MNIRTYQRLEAAENSPSMESLYELAKTLKTHPREFFDFDFPNEPEKDRK